MKKGILVALLAIGFIFTGVISASAGAVTWSLVQDASYAGTAPHATRNLLCVTGTGSSSCNMDSIADCINVGSPSSGSCSYARLNFQMASSCAAGLTGQSCTQNSDCGNPLTPCVPCNPPGQVGLTFFGTNPSGGAKGTGTYTGLHCDNDLAITAVAIGTSEVVSHVGGSCMTLQTLNSASGCGEGLSGTNYDLSLWTSTVGSCGFPAGTMPGLALNGRIMAAGATTAVCGYTAGELTAIASTAGGSHLSVLCGSGTLPTSLQSVCIPGAPWNAVVVASATYNPTSECPAACPQGCTGAAAEGVE